MICSPLKQGETEGYGEDQNQECSERVGIVREQPFTELLGSQVVQQLKNQEQENLEFNTMEIELG